MFPRITTGLIFFITSLGLIESSLAQINGALFTTNYEREYLDAAREQYLAQQAAQGFDIEASPPPIIEDSEIVENEEAVIFHLGGVVTRQNGSRSVWLNNTLIRETELPAGLSISNSSELIIRTEEQFYTLKSGQTLNLTSGQISESFQLANSSQLPPDLTEAEVSESLQAVSVHSTTSESSNDNEGISESGLEDLGLDPESIESYLSELEALQANEEASL